VDEDDQIMEREHGIYAVKAQTAIEEFNEFFGTELDEDEFDTIGGLMLKEFRTPPEARRIHYRGSVPFQGAQCR